MKQAVSGSSRSQRGPRHGVTACGRALAATAALLVVGLASPSDAQSPRAPLDRSVVTMSPVYPTPSAGFLRLPDTQTAPVTRPRGLEAGPVGATFGARPVEPGDRPVWQPSRLEAVPVIDARGRVTSILEYTPARFDR